ncbi:MAG: hypothetical protein GAK37_02457 [Pseudomonas sp.]|nr:MAG: hypothetical protein GAK37_02457 [Pseudomonas sp.]
MITRINLLPWREAQGARRRLYFLVFLLVIACVALAAVWLANQVIDQAIDRQVSRNNHLSKEVTVLDSRIKTIDELHEQRQQVMARMKVVQDVQHERSTGGELFDQLSRAVPDGVQLHEVTVEGRTVQISGSAESNQDVARLMRGLEATNGLQAPRLQQVQGTQVGGGSEFQMKVRQVGADEVQR